MLLKVACCFLLSKNEPREDIPTKVMTAPMTVIKLSAAVPDIFLTAPLQ